MLIGTYRKLSFFCPAFLLVTVPYTGFIPNYGKAVTGTLPADSTSAATKVNTVKSASAPPIRLNPHATRFVRQYCKENEEPLLKAKERGEHCFPMMDSVLGRYGLPVELKYLAVVESELDPKAVSAVGAAGPWQLMPGTARQLGLKIKGHYDERKYFNKSTVAAALYLRDLYSEFGDWLLVIAAYNSGPGPVYQAIRQSGSRNFWKLQYFLPAETRGHVKRFIGTHYFFEGRGSVTTLTKAEVKEYQGACALHKLTRNATRRDNRTASLPASSGIAVTMLSGTFIRQNS